jgi:hypothetical protein
VDAAVASPQLVLGTCTSTPFRSSSELRTRFRGEVAVDCAGDQDVDVHRFATVLLDLGVLHDRSKTPLR